VSDNGIGIPENDLPNLFQKFSKVNRKGSQLPGAGFGLAAVKQIVDMHKGLVKVESQEQKGTTIIVRLPK
jgi:two-component system sensor histidine kinase VicK